MPCKNMSSGMTIELDHQERFCSFDFSKISCGKKIEGETGYAQYCAHRDLTEILAISYDQALADLNIEEEESQFILYLEWDALRSVLSQYCGHDDEFIDAERCQIISIEQQDRTISITLQMFPPSNLPDIRSCERLKKS